MFNPNSTLEITINTGYWTVLEDYSEIPETRQITVPAYIEKTALTQDGAQHFIGFALKGSIADWEFKAVADAISDLEHPTIGAVTGSIENGDPVEMLIWERRSKDNPAAVIATMPDRLAIQGKILPTQESTP